MPLVTFHDAAGIPMQFMRVGGILYPYIKHADQDRSIPAARNIPGRDDDVLLISFPKSGTHWLWEILCMLYQGKAETIPKIKQYHMIEGLTPEQLEALPSPRILNSHFYYHTLPLEMLRRRVKIVLLIRNPKDVAVSLFHPLRNLVKLFNYHVEYNGWFSHSMDWERAVIENPDYPIHVMYYEDMKEDSVREIGKIKKFLCLDVSHYLCKEIADKCQFDQMKRDKAGLENGFWRTAWRDNKPNFFRKGIVGDWKNWFTVAQNEEFDKIYREKMKDSNLKIRFEI